MEEIKIITAAELAERMKNGETVELVHAFSSPNDVLKPRGSMQKNSIGEYMFQKLVDSWESWTDPKYSDNPPVDMLMEILCTNFRGECTAALEKFFDHEQVRKAFPEKFSIPPK